MKEDGRKNRKVPKENYWQNLEYYIKRNPDKNLEECKLIWQQALLKSKQSKPTNIEYWKLKYPDYTDEQINNVFIQYKKENCFQCIEYYIKRNPDKTLEECQKLLDDAKKSYIKKRPDNHGKNNPAHKSNTTEQQRKERSASCIEFWRRKYPNATEEELNEYLKNHLIKLKQSHTPENTMTRIEYWLARGYDEEVAYSKVKEEHYKRTFTLEKCIAKYGREKGIEIFNKRQEKWKKSLYKNFEKHGDGRSSQSKFAHNIICKICDYLNLNIQDYTKEKWMTDPVIDRHYAYDFTYGNKIIEFNGDYWHANPDIYDSNFFNIRKNMTAEEIWLYDKQKLQCAHKNGYKIHIVWENNWNNNNEEEFKKCIDFLIND